MTTVGRHSPPLDGVTVANGYHLEPFTIPSALQARPRGPVSLWPQPQPVSRDWWRHARRVMTGHRAWLAAVPIVLVNSVAFAGQLSFLRTHLPWPIEGQVLIAVTLESVAVYLAWQAHLALAADDSAMRLRLAAYSFAAVIGVMNYSHWMAPGWRPTFTAITFGLMSVSSPWLWSVHSRRASRDALKARGLIEPHAVRLGATRWQWHPLRSWRVMFRATWIGETDPAVAIALLSPPGPPAGTVDDVPDGDAIPPAEPPDSRQDEPQPAPPATATEPPPENASKPVTRRQPAKTATAKATATLKRHPDWDDARVMASAGVSKRTVERARSELAKASS